MLNVLKLFDQQAAQKPVAKLRLVCMPKLDCIGELMETPARRHPQENDLGTVFCVSEMRDEADNGVYVVKIDYLFSKAKLQICLSGARKITSELPARDRLYPAFGQNEVELEPHPIREDSEMGQLFLRDHQKHNPDFHCVIT